MKEKTFDTAPTGSVNDKYIALKFLVFIWICLSSIVSISHCVDIEVFSRIAPITIWACVMLIEKFYK